MGSIYCYVVCSAETEFLIDMLPLVCLAELPDARAATPVASVVRSDAAKGAVTVTTEAGRADVYDAVVFATHR